MNPAACVGASLSPINSSLILFGGSDEGATTNGQSIVYYDQLFILEPRRLIWTRLSPVPGPGPCPRGRHSAVTFANQLFVYGGIGSQGTLQDFFVLDLSKWPLSWAQVLPSAGSVWPGPRASAQLVSVGEYLYLFGGLNGAEFVSYDFFDDLLRFDPASSSWTKIADYTGVPPSRRYGYGMASLGGVIYVFGGQNTTGPLGGLYAFDPEAKRWACISKPDNAPEARFSMGLAALDSHRILLFGGGNYYGVLNDLHVFDSNTGGWSLLSTSGTIPSQRRGMAMAAVGQQALLFGGTGGSGSGILNDIWDINGPADVAWPLEAAAGLFVGVYDWDSILLDPADGVDILPLQVVLCTRLFPCALQLIGQRAGNSSGLGYFVRTGHGSIMCSAGDGCSGISVDNAEILCTGTSLAEFSLFEIDRSALSMSRVRVHGCRSHSDGSAVQCYGGGGATVQVTRSSFTSTATMGVGGAVAVLGCAFYAQDTTFAQCQATGDGGALAASQFICYGNKAATSTSARLESCSFIGCSSGGNGGAIYVETSQATLSVNSSDFSWCNANASGGSMAIRSGANATLSRVTFVGNRAQLGGGALSLGSSTSVVLSHAVLSGNSALGVGGGAVFLKQSPLFLDGVDFRNNSALAGGGGALFWEGVEPTLSNRSSLDSSPGIAGGIGSLLKNLTQNVSWDDALRRLRLFEHLLCQGGGNVAMDGHCVASSYMSLMVLGLPTTVYPGLPFEVVLYKKDAYNQTITTDSKSLLQTIALVSGGDSNTYEVDQSVSVAGEFIGSLSLGRVTLTLSVKPAFQLIDAQSGTTQLSRPVVLLILGTDTMTGDEMKSSLVTPNFAAGSSVCPRGYILALEAASSKGGRMGSCSRCSTHQYSVSPLAGPTAGVPSCFNCLPSADCNGGDDVVFKLGKWTISGGMFTLVGCPSGYQLVNKIGGVFSHDVQDCVKCDVKQYIVDSNNSDYSCQNCPLGARCLLCCALIHWSNFPCHSCLHNPYFLGIFWAIRAAVSGPNVFRCGGSREGDDSAFPSCDGTTFTSLVAGAIWQVDETGRYLLLSCPPGYARQAATLDAQQCVRCAARYYCVGGTAPASPCTDGSFSPVGSNSSSACVPSVMVQVQAVLPMLKEQFGDTEESRFVEALAAAADVDTSLVVVLQVPIPRH
mmetsp:Transcript_36696/g.96835  ORF Transcript_36696/g.96835 Transcript_36696/m.96835 type:complete len:1159 (+) Transcript_36696:1876-5352(+)